MIGILLGCANIVRASPTANCKLVYCQIAVKNVWHFYRVYGIFVPLCCMDFLGPSNPLKKGEAKKTYSFISFSTIELACFNIFKEMFYSLEEKKVPDNIYELLTARGLAFWLMDQASRHRSGMYIDVCGYTITDIDKLILTLKNKFNIKCSLQYKNKKPRIYIFKKSMDTLIVLVKPYLYGEVLYKWGL